MSERSGRREIRAWIDIADAEEIMTIAKNDDSSAARIIRLAIREWLDWRKERNGKRSRSKTP